MTAERIKEIQSETAYSDSQSVQQALMKVWNECSQQAEKEKKELVDEMGMYVEFVKRSIKDDRSFNNQLATFSTFYDHVEAIHKKNI